MARGAALTGEDHSSNSSQRVAGIWICRRLQRYDVLRERKHCLIGLIEDDTLLIVQHSVRSEIGDITAGDERGVAHDIGVVSELMRRRVVDVLSLADPDEIRDFGL